jgi:hypothetical protein
MPSSEIGKKIVTRCQMLETLRSVDEAAVSSRNETR